MRNSKLFFTALSISIVLSSCSKDEDNETTNPTPGTYDNYSALKVGNYWIYQRYEVDTLGNETPTSVFDSCFVESDTTINSQIYHKLFRPNLNPFLEYTYQRDSFECIVNSNGEILFSSVDFVNNLYSGYISASPGDTVCELVRKMTDKNMLVNLPYGSLLASDAKETYHMYPSWSLFGNPRTRHAKYSKDIGLVVETLPFYANVPEYTERRLVRYHVN